MKKIIYISLLAFLMVALAACGNSADEKKEDDKSANGDKEQEEIVVSHELGETKVKTEPKNVVVFDYGALDTLDELDVDIKGVSKQTLPPYLEQYEDDMYENIGSLKEPDFEKIAEIDPDLILISGRQSDLYDELSKLGPTVFIGVDQENYMESFKENMDIMGRIFSKESEVEEAVATIDDQISEVQEKAEEKNEEALIVLANDDKISAYGSNSRFGFIHDVLNVPAVDEDIEVATHGMSVSFEYVKEKNPAFLYVIDRSAAIGEDSAVKDVVENVLVKSTDAYKNDNIIYLDPYYWYLSGGGLQSVPGMIDEISESLN